MIIVDGASLPALEHLTPWMDTLGRGIARIVLPTLAASGVLSRLH